MGWASIFHRLSLAAVSRLEDSSAPFSQTNDFITMYWRILEINPPVIQGFPNGNSLIETLHHRIWN